MIIKDNMANMCAKETSTYMEFTLAFGPKPEFSFSFKYKQVHCVNLTQSTIEANKRFFASADDVPKQAYTMGIKTIMQAKKILIVASGEDKAEIVRDAFFGPITPKVPASVLQLHNDVTLVADEAALSKLPL